MEYKINITGTLDAAKTQKNINNEIANLRTNVNINANTKQAELNIRSLQRQMNGIINNAKEYGKAQQALDTQASANKVKELASRYENLNNKLKNVFQNEKVIAAGREKLNTISGEIKNQVEDTKDLNQALSTQDKFALNLGASWKKAFTSFTMYMSVTTLFYSSIKIISSMVQQVASLDASLVDLQKVTDLSGSSLSDFVDKAYAASDAIGVTGQSIIDATTIFAQAGYNVSDSLDLAQVATIMTNVGDGIDNVSTAATSLISVLKAYNLTAADAYKVTDLINEVSNTSAVSFGDLTNGLTRAGAVFAQAGTSVEELTGLLTGTNEIMQNMEKSSSGLITISERLRGVTDLADDGYQGVSHLSTEFKRLAGIDIYDAEGQLRDTYDILKDMSDVWTSGKLTENAKQYLAELAAGKRQVNVLESLLTNWKAVDGAVQSALNSEGSATKENSKFIDSVQGKMNRFTNEFQKAANNLIGSGLVKFFIDLGTGVLSFVNTPGGQFLIFVAAAIAGTSGFKAVLELTSKPLKDWINNILAATAASKGLTVAELTLADSAKAVTAAMATNPLTWIALAITLIPTLINYFDKLNVSASEAYDNANKALETAQSELDNVNAKLAETKSKIDTLKNKDKLTLTEKDDLNNLTLQNIALEAQNDLLKKNVEEKKKAKEAAANTKYSEIYGTGEVAKSTAYTKGVGWKNKDITGTTYSSSKNQVNTFQVEDDGGIGKLISKYNELYKVVNKTTAQQKEFSNTQDELTNHYNTLDTAIKETSGKEKDYLTGLRDKILEVTSPNGYKQIKISELLQTDDLKNVSDKLIDLGKNGEVTAEEVDKLREGSTEFDSTLKGLGFTSQDVVDALGTVGSAAQDSGQAFTDTVDNILKSSSSLVSSISSINDALMEYNDNGQLSVETALDVIDQGYAAALSYNAETGAITIDRDSVIALTKAKIALQQTDITSKINETVAALENEAKVCGINTDTWLNNIRVKQQAGQELSANEQSLLSLYSQSSALDKVTSSLSKIGTDSFSKVISTKAATASANTKKWWEKELDALKDQFSNSEITIDSYINSLASLQSKLKVGSDAWKEVNRILKDAKLDRIEDAYKRGSIGIEEYIRQLRELASQYKTNTTVWNELADKIKEANLELLNDTKDKYDQAYDAISKSIDDEIDKMKNARDAVEERYNSEIDAKKKSNDETEKAIELSKAEERLANAQKEKNKRVYRSGIGWVWETDQTEISAAQSDLDSLKKDKEISDLEDARDAELKIWDSQIDSLTDYKDKWADITNSYQEQQDRLALLQIMGANAESSVLSQRLDVLENFKNKYNSILSKIDITEATPSINNLSTVSVPRYAEGGRVDYTGLAVLDGTPTAPEWVLNNDQMKNMISSLIKPGTVAKGSGVSNGNSYVYNFDNLILPNVQNPLQFLTELKSNVNITKNQ